MASLAPIYTKNPAPYSIRYIFWFYDRFMDGLHWDLNCITCPRYTKNSTKESTFIPPVYNPQQPWSHAYLPHTYPSRIWTATCSDWEYSTQIRILALIGIVIAGKIDPISFVVGSLFERVGIGVRNFLNIFEILFVIIFSNNFRRKQDIFQWISCRE